MNDIAVRWTSRKFWAAMIWEAVLVWLLYMGKLPVDAFESLTWLLLGGYFLGNVAQKVLLKGEEVK
ncbi:hypothetical protein PaTs2_57 [Pseudomonas phage PaTs-2]|nr:hypothetical protein PaTs2_57 [Pseudomonas phage PaTs-2]QAX99412.1 hypothetical protein PaSz4_33 [Pseudomonas phage PaSz-4]WNV49138.1 hypothetical protein [Pseudomonas phage Chuck]